MFMTKLRTLAQVLTPTIFYTKIVTSVGTGAQPFTFIPDPARKLAQVVYSRRGGHSFSLTATLQGRESGSSLWVTLVTTPQINSPVTPETTVDIPEELQAVYTEYLLTTTSGSASSRIANLYVSLVYMGA